MHLGKEQFRCQLCGDEHQVPKKGFQINKNIQRGLKMELHKAFGSNPAFEECKSHIENASKVIRQLEVLRDSPEGYIHDYFEEVKRQVDLRREKLKNEIDLSSDQMIDRIERTRAECIQVSAQMKGKVEYLIRRPCGAPFPMPSECFCLFGIPFLAQQYELSQKDIHFE